MKVMHILASSGGWGGLEKIVCELALEQFKQGLEVKVAAVPEIAKRLPDEIAVPLPLGKSRLSPFLIAGLLREISKREIQIVQGHANKGAYLARTIKRLIGSVASVATLHNTKKNVSMFRGHDAVTAVSRFAASRLSQIPARVVRNGLKLPEVVSVPPNLPKERNCQFLLGAYGRFVEAKGFDVLLEVLANEPRAELWLIGDGPLRVEFEAQAERLGLSERVWFGGFREDAADVMRQVDLVVMPSRHEGFPLTLIEALHREIPILASRVAGAEEAMPMESLAKPGDQEDLARLLTQALGDVEAWKEMLDDTFRMAREELTVEAAAKEYSEVYREVLAARAGA